MRAADVAFVGALVQRFVVLEVLLQEHLDAYDSLLPHVFLGDVTRWIVASADEASPDLHDILDFFESSYAQAGEDVRELLAASFLENIPRPGQAGSGVRSLLGSELTVALQRIG